MSRWRPSASSRWRRWRRGRRWRSTFVLKNARGPQCATSSSAIPWMPWSAWTTIRPCSRRSLQTPWDCRTIRLRPSRPRATRTSCGWRSARPRASCRRHSGFWEPTRTRVGSPSACRIRACSSRCRWQPAAASSAPTTRSSSSTRSARSFRSWPRRTWTHPIRAPARCWSRSSSPGVKSRSKVC